MPFRHIIRAREQSIVAGKKCIVLVVKEARDHRLVFREKFPEGGKRIGCYVEGTALNVRKERPERWVMKNEVCKRLVFERLAEDCTAVVGNIFRGIGADKCDEGIGAMRSRARCMIRSRNGREVVNNRKDGVGVRTVAEER